MSLVANSCWYSPQCVGINDLHEKVLRGCPSFEMCCFFDGHHGARCWDAQAGYTYERCCSLGSENNERHIPLWHSRWILLELRNGGYLNISQEPTSNEWAAYRDENIPGLLWKSAYAMFRWLEALAAPPFQIFRGRRVLELGAGIGLLSIMAALGGAAEVVSTDASWSSVGLIERNAQYTHTRGVRGAVAARQLDWANVTNMQSERLARRRLQDLQIGPGPFDVVICSALGYVKLTTFKALLCILDLVTDQQSLLLWGGGGSSTNDLNVSAAWPTRGGRKDEKLQLLLEAFRIAGRPFHLGGEGALKDFKSFKLRRRSRWPGCWKKVWMLAEGRWCKREGATEGATGGIHLPIVQQGAVRTC
ncbi:unnamed protein product [Durusdinium trenchii]|uniref:Calmodulin-lysine N-methyltransferase n=1 Tax=Durusdinium trenchii TaxID=1381693 RepID=A0ABP0NV24_9DINO